MAKITGWCLNIYWKEGPGVGMYNHFTMPPKVNNSISRWLDEIEAKHGDEIGAEIRSEGEKIRKQQEARR